MERSAPRQKEKDSLKRYIFSRAFLYFLIMTALLGFVSESGDRLALSRFIHNQWLGFIVRFSADSQWQPMESVLVAYDNASMRMLGFPLSREYYGEAASNLAATDPRGFYFDIIFGSSEDSKNTKKFTDELDELKVPVTLAAISSPDRDIPDSEVLQSLWKNIAPQASFTADQFIETSWPPILSDLRSIAMTESHLDDDGILRWYPLVHSFGHGYIPSFGLKAVLDHYQTQKFEVVENEKGIKKILIQTQDKAIELDLSADPELRGRMLLIPKIKSKEFPVMSLINVLERNFDPHLFSKKSIFIGGTVDGVSSPQATMLEAVQQPIESHMFAYEDILQSKIVKPLPYGNLIVFVSGALMLLAALLLPAVNLYALAGVGFSLIFLIGVFSFWLAKLNFYPILSGLILSAAGCLILQVLRRFESDQRQRRTLQKAFSHYLHPSLVSRIGDAEESVALGGENRSITIYFCDLRNFTSISEMLSAEELVELMNDYFEIVTEEIQNTGGTVDKYIGDAVMAFWNAPLKVEDPALKALQSCRAIDHAFSKFAEKWKLRSGGLQLDMGMAIHSGKAIVGNVGSRNRFNYTAIGDDVNLTSRLEGLTKYYGVRTLISGSVQKEVRDSSLVLLDRVKVKGKKHPVELFVDAAIFELVSPGDWASFFNHYSKGNWVQSEQALVKINMLPWTQEFSERIEVLKNRDGQWDGIWAFENK